MMKPVGIRPVRDLILVLPEENITQKEMKIQLPEFIKDKQKMQQIFGTIVAMGEGAFKYEEKQYGVRPVVKVGDRIMFARYGGMIVTGADKVKYRMISDDDVVAVVSDDVKYEIE